WPVLEAGPVQLRAALTVRVAQEDLAPHGRRGVAPEVPRGERAHRGSRWLRLAEPDVQCSRGEPLGEERVLRDDLAELRAAADDCVDVEVEVGVQRGLDVGTESGRAHARVDEQVPRLQVRLHIGIARAGERCAHVGHRHPAVAADVDAAQEDHGNRHGLPPLGCVGLDEYSRSVRRSPAMAQVGDKIPDVEVRVMNAEGAPETVKTGDVLGRGKVVLFAVPGAFTPGCSKIHLPGYVANASELKAKGVDTIACIAVNDAWVMDAWSKDQGAEGKVLMLADGSGDFTKAMDLVMDGSGFGL